MTQIGKLVRLQSGRWARFQKLKVHGDENESIIVAVELEASEHEELEASIAEASSEELSLPVFSGLERAATI